MKKILEHGLYILIFLLPWQTRWIIKAGDLNGYSEYNTYSLYGTEILLWLFFIIFAISSLNNVKFTIYNLQFKVPMIRAIARIIGTRIVGNSKIPIISILLFFCFVILVIISTVLALNPALAFYSLFKIFEGGALAFLIYKLADFKKTILAFSGGIIIQAAIAIWQFFTQSIFSSKWLGVASQSASNLGASVIETESGRWLRAYGAFPHPNILAGYLAIAILLLIIFFIHINKKNKFTIPTIIVLSAALFLTFGRAAWIALLLSLLILLFSNLKSKINFQRTIVAILALFIAPAIISIIYTPLVKTRFDETGRLEKKSENERIQSYLEAVKIIKQYPFFGTGPGNYTLGSKNNINSDLKSFAYQPTHNIYLLLMAEFGILSFILLIILFIIYNLKFKIILLSPILIIGLFDHYLASIYIGIMLMGFIFGLCLLSSKSKITG